MLPGIFDYIGKRIMIEHSKFENELFYQNLANK